MPPVSTTSLKAETVMDRAAALMNDTQKAVYTHDAVLPYLNMAIDEMQEQLAESNMSPTDKTASFITLDVGKNKLTPTEDADTPHYPYDLIEIQSIGERLAGSSDAFVPMNRRDFLNVRNATDALVDWMWQDQYIQFYLAGATTSRELKLDYIRQPIQLAQNKDSVIGTIGSRSYLSFKTAAFCARYIGENPTRADALDDDADGAINRMLGISAKGRQQWVTRRRPFRSAYKSRGWY